MRQKITYTVPGDGPRDKPGHRDDGKQFIITEPDADKGERLSAFAKALFAEALKIEEPRDDIGHAAGLASMGIDFSDPRVNLVLTHPTLDALLDCVQYLHNPKHPPQEICKGENSQIEEIATRKLLRTEVMCLFLGFSRGAAAPASETSPALTA